MKRAIIIAAAAILLASTIWSGAQMFAQLFGATGTPSRLPAGYRECDYLESSGTQYIDTGIAPTLYGTSISVDCMGLAAYNRMWGVSENIGGTIMRYREYFTSDGFAYVGAQAPISLGHAISNRAVIAISGGVVTIDGVSKGTYGGADATLTLPILLFAERDGAVQRGRSRVYSARLWTGATLVRDFVPALDDSGVPCMFDLVTSAPFYNAGTGTFAYKLKE